MRTIRSNYCHLQRIGCRGVGFRRGSWKEAGSGLLLRYIPIHKGREKQKGRRNVETETLTLGLLTTKNGSTTKTCDSRWTLVRGNHHEYSFSLLNTLVVLRLHPLETLQLQQTNGWIDRWKGLTMRLINANSLFKWGFIHFINNDLMPRDTTDVTTLPGSQSGTPPPSSSRRRETWTISLGDQVVPSSRRRRT